jgi:hypothetical protein
MEISQKEYERPDPRKPNGVLTLNYYYFQSVIGWALSLLAVARFSGLVKSKQISAAQAGRLGNKRKYYLLDGTSPNCCMIARLSMRFQVSAI